MYNNSIFTHKSQVTNNLVLSSQRQNNRLPDTYAPEKIKKRKGGKNWQLSEEREERLEEAKALLLGLVEQEDIPPMEVINLYYAFYPDVIPYPVRGSPQKESYIAWRKFNKEGKPASRLFSELDRPHLYTLHAENLNLNPKYGDSRHFYLGSFDPELRDTWKLALEEAFGKAARFIKLENAERFHCHGVLEHDAGLLHIPRGGEVIKPVTDAEGIMAYLYKPHATNTRENLGQWIHAKRILGQEGKNLPQASDYYNLPRIEKSDNPSVLSKDREKEQYINLDTSRYIEYIEEIKEGKYDNNTW